MDLVVMVGGTFAALWISYQVCSRYPKHFAAFVVVGLGGVMFWVLRKWGKI